LLNLSAGFWLYLSPRVRPNPTRFPPEHREGKTQGMSPRLHNISILVAGLGYLLTVQSGHAHDMLAPPGPGEPFRVDWFGRWSYAAALVPYYLLLAALAIRYRIILRFATWKFFFTVSALLFMVLGVTFEWIADVLYVWSFPPERDLFMMRVPIFGWFTGHKIPVCEFLWILGVVPLFYYLYLWATLVFYDIVYVVDENGNTYKKEERWVGFHEPSHIFTRPKGRKGREFEKELLVRAPGVVSRTCKRFYHAHQP